MEHRDFIRAGLEYVCLIQEVQEKKKFEFVEIVSVLNKKNCICRVGIAYFQKIIFVVKVFY
jgi:hypothetical protein